MEGVKRFCPHCGSEIKEGEKFCTYCGSKIDAAVISKTETPSEGIQNNQTDDKPGNDNDVDKILETKKKPKVGLIIFLVLVAAVAIYGITSYNNYSKRINAINAASDFYNAVLEDATTLENIGNDTQTEWGEAIWGDTYNSIDDGIKAATEKNQEDIEAVIENYSNITSLYQEATSLLGPLEDKQALNDAVKDLYNGYVDLYDVVINFNCTYQEFCDDFSEADQKSASAGNTLYALLQQ